MLRLTATAILFSILLGACATTTTTAPVVTAEKEMCPYTNAVGIEYECPCISDPGGVRRPYYGFCMAPGFTPPNSTFMSYGECKDGTLRKKRLYASNTRPSEPMFECYLRAECTEEELSDELCVDYQTCKPFDGYDGDDWSTCKPFDQQQ